MGSPLFIASAPSCTDISLNRKGTQIVLWTEDQELELQRLFEAFQDSDGKGGRSSGNLCDESQAIHFFPLPPVPREGYPVPSVHLVYLWYQF